MESHHKKSGSNMKDVILGGQDGLVNVLGVILAVAVATYDTKIVIIAGLAAAFAESISMAAVAYTSTKAALSYCLSQIKNEEQEIKNNPTVTKKEIYDVYYKKGFKGPLLNQVIKKITSNKQVWLNTLMSEQHCLKEESYKNPLQIAFVVGISAMVGSLIPLMSFFFFDVKTSIIISIIFSALALFVTGAIKAKLTVGNWLRSGFEILGIGMTAALVGYLIGILFGNVNF
ncbi:VIT1/CCC1 transporter family protein [Candidatus Woesearchaeota archaeon]|nr:VIT1/CCC1 transporter family protein [Candidatus Woesearchaeota archaeon]